MDIDARTAADPRRSMELCFMRTIYRWSVRGVTTLSATSSPFVPNATPDDTLGSQLVKYAMNSSVPSTDSDRYLFLGLIGRLTAIEAVPQGS